LSDALRVTLLQTAPHLAHVDANARDILDLARRAHAAGTDLLVTPELSLSGYDLRDRMAEVALTPERAAALLADAGAIVAGFPERTPDGAVYNVAAHVDGGRVVHSHRKVFLPTYGMFDEGRVFAPGQDVHVYEHNGWRVGLLVCEDYWHPGLVYALAAQRMEVLIAVAAAPGRGVLDADGDARFSSWAAWRQIAEVYARLLGIYVVLVNRVGVEEGVTFAGGSLVASPSGEVVAECDEHVGTVHATLERAELARTRTPAWHGRDDRPLVVARALLRVEGLDA
jgi:predicted amidohydrolase